MSKQIFVNGKIFTSDDSCLNASAMIVEDSLIKWVGDEAELPERDGEIVDLNGARVIPGLVDCHMHPQILAAATKKIACLPPEIYSIEELLAEVRRRRELQGPGQWIQGWGYDEGKLAERRAPNRYDLDKAAPDAPVAIVRTCVHIWAVNSEALRIAGIDRNTPDPVGGEIERDENGEPTGILKESARELVMNKVPVADPEQTAEDLAQLGQKLLAHGITGFGDSMAKYEPVDSYELYQMARRKGLKQHVAMYYQWQQTDELRRAGRLPENLSERQDRSRPVYAAGLKILGDGSISGRTAWMSRPYLDDGGNCGMCTTSEEELLAAADYAAERDLQIQVHAMGERTIDLIVDTLKTRKPWTTGRPHLRLEHMTLPSKQAMKDAAASGIAFTIQPVFLFCEIETYLRYIGAEELKETYPVADVLASGVKLAFGSDAPATSWADPSNPFIGMQFAVTRIAWDGTECGQRHRIDVPTTVKLYTKESAEVLGMEGAGRIAPGFRADFAVLDRDIFEIDLKEIGGTKVMKTYLEGSLVYSR